MHLRFNFDACPMHSPFGFVHLTHQNLSTRALFCLNSLVKVNTQLLICKGQALILTLQGRVKKGREEGEQMCMAIGWYLNLGPPENYSFRDKNSSNNFSLWSWQFKTAVTRYNLEWLHNNRYLPQRGQWQYHDFRGPLGTKCISGWGERQKFKIYWKLLFFANFCPDKRASRGGQSFRLGEGVNAPHASYVPFWATSGRGIRAACWI